MLVLPRKENETLFIGDNVVVTVAGIGSGKVRLGVVAPPSVPAMRSGTYRTAARP
jgi:carbon storage regulator CsrA